MSTEVTKLVLAVDSSQANRASRDLDSLSKAGKRSEQAVGGLRAAVGALGVVFAGLGAANLARSFVQQADTFANLNARLRLVTGTTAEFIEAQRELFSIAQRTGSGIEQTADLYGSLRRSTEELGVSQKDVLAVTETIGQAIAVSGASAQGAQAALVQLGQGFAAGALRGEELNSVLEQTPRLARAIADGLGVSVGQLRALGQSGQLTGERVFEALRRSGATLQQEFDQLPLTVGRASQQASNSLLALIGTLNETSGATDGLAVTIQETAGLFDELAAEIQKVRRGEESVSILAHAFVTLIETLRVVAANVSFVLKAMGREAGAIAAQIGALARLDMKAFRAISEAVKADAVRARAELDAFQKSVLTRAPPAEVARPGAGKPPTTGGGLLEGAEAAAAAAKRIEATDVKKLKSLREELTALLGIQASGKGDPKATAEAIKRVREEIEKVSSGRTDRAGISRARQEAAATLRFDIEAIKAAAQERIGIQRNAEAVTEALRSAGLIDERAYYAEKRRLMQETARIQVEALEAENKRLGAQKLDAKDRIDRDREVLRNQQEIAALRAGLSAQELILHVQETAAIRERESAIRSATQAQEDYLASIRRDLARQREGMGLGNEGRSLLAGIGQIEDRYEGQRRDLENSRALLELEGKFTEEARQQYEQRLELINEFLARATQEYRAHYDELTELNRDWSVGASEAIANYLSDITNVAGQTEQVLTKAFKGIEDALVNVVTTGKLDFKELANSIVADITRMIIRAQIMLPLMKAMGLGGGAAATDGAAGGIGGLATKFFGALFGGGRRNGGPVAGGRIYEVTEGGEPEMLRMNGRNFLLPGGDGHVTPMRGVQGGATSQPTVVNYSPTFVLSGPVDHRTQEQVAQQAYAGAQRAWARNS